MIFDNVNLLGYRHESKFLGGSAVLVGITKTLDISGYILDLTNSEGVKNIVQDVSSIKQELQSFKDIVLNGKNYGRGKVKSFSVESGNWVRTTTYQATFEILEEVSILGISSKEFNSLDINNLKLHLIKDFNESFTIDFDKNNKILRGSHSLDLQYDSKDLNSDLLSEASFLASALLSTLPDSLAEGNYVYRTNAVQTNSENYNLIDGKCGFTRTFNYNNENVNKPYSIERTNSIELSESGLVSVSERCQIKVEDLVEYEDAILSAIKQEIDDSYSRCSSTFNKYRSKFNISISAMSLIERPIQISKTIDKFNRSGSYDISYDNDEKRLNSSYTYDQTLTLSRTEDFIWTVSENGTITGRGKTGSPEKFNLAQSGWSNIKVGIENRVTNFYFSASTETNGILKKVSESVDKNKYSGVINYTYEYSDDPQIVTDGKKITVSRDDTGLIIMSKDFIIPNQKYALKQNRGYLQQGTHKVSVNMQVGCVDANESQNFNGLAYFNELKSKAGFDRSKFGGQSIDDYLESISFTSDEIERNLTYEETYKYS
jgi:hypothetical protein